MQLPTRIFCANRSIKKFRSLYECQAGSLTSLNDSKSLKRLKQAHRAQKMLGFSRNQRLQALGVSILSPKPVLKKLSVRLERMTAEQLASVSSHSSLDDEDGYKTTSTDPELCREADSMEAIDTYSVGDGEKLKEIRFDEAATPAADEDDEVVRPTSELSCKCKADQQSDGAETGFDDCLNSETGSSLTDKCTKSISSVISLSKVCSPASTDDSVSASQAIFISVPYGSDMEMPASEDQNLVTASASSSVNNGARKGDDVELVGAEDKETQDDACHCALSDEGSGGDVGQDSDSRHQMDLVNAEDAVAIDSVGDGDISGSSRVDKASASAADGEDAVVRHTLKKSSECKIDKQSSLLHQETSELDDCLESDKHSSVTDKCEESSSSVITIGKSRILPSSVDAPSQVILAPSFSRNDMEIGQCPESRDQNSLVCSNLNRTVEKGDAVEQLGDKVEHMDDKFCALDDENVSTELELRQAVNAEDSSFVNGVGDRNTSGNLGVDEAPASAAGGEDAVVKRTIKKSRKRKVEQRSGGPGSLVGGRLEPDKLSSVGDKCTESLASYAGVSKSNILLASDCSETVLAPSNSGNDLEIAVGHCRASVDQNSLVSSNLNKTVKKADCTKTTVTPGRRITATSIDCKKSNVTDDATKQHQENRGPVDADRRSRDDDGVWNHRGNVGKKRRRFSGRGTARRLSTSPQMDHSGDFDCRVQSELGQGKVRGGRGCGRFRGRTPGRGGRGGYSLADPTHQHLVDGASHDGGVNEIMGSEYLSLLRHLSAIPVSSVDATSMLQSMPAAAAPYTGETKYGL